MTHLPLSTIQVPDGRRSLRDVEKLVDSIKEVGLLNPITVTPDHTLIAGYHRLEACRKLGWEEIPVLIVELDGLKAELAEIDENLVRSELTVLERGESLSRCKEIYEALHPMSKRGGDRGNQHTGGKKRQSEVISFSQDSAQKTGVTARTIQQEVQIVTKLTPESKDAVRSTPIADSKTDLLKLARLHPDDQKLVAEKISSGEAQTVKEATDMVDPEKKIQKEIRDHLKDDQVMKVHACMKRIVDFNESMP